MSKTTIKKAQKLEAAGDAFAAKGDYKKALRKYRQAAKDEPGRPGLYDKLIAAHEKASSDWKKKDFIESLTWTMKKQELEEPAIKQVHAKLSPEWKKALEVAVKLINAPEDETAKLTEELVATGEVGTRVLIEIMRFSLKEKINHEDTKNTKKDKKNPPLPPFTKGGCGGILIFLVSLVSLW